MKKVSLFHRFFSRFYGLIFNSRRVLATTLDNSLKRKIIETNFSMFFLGQLGSDKRVARIAGQKINYCMENSLRVLFDEVFIRQEYFFASETDQPFIIDCGSNIGMSILYFKLLFPRSEILAFEPDIEAFACLERNILQNNLANVAIHQKALSNFEGTIDFYYDQNNPGSLRMSTVRDRMPKQKRVVECTLLSRFIEKEVDLLKIDVEGAEEGILEDLRRENKLCFVKQMVLEYHHHIKNEPDRFSKLLKLLENAGFGYQIESSLSRPLRSHKFQDILVYAYQRGF